MRTSVQDDDVSLLRLRVKDIDSAFEFYGEVVRIKVWIRSTLNSAVNQFPDLGMIDPRRVRDPACLRSAGAHTGQ